MSKKTFISICTFIISIVVLFIFMGLNTPNMQLTGMLLGVIILIYFVSFSFIYTMLSIFTKNSSKSVLSLSLLLGCVLPILIILNNLKQASLFDLMLLGLTIGLIIWYALNKR